MIDQAFLTPHGDGLWQVCWQGRVLPTTFNSKGAALAYLAGLRNGRKPV